MAEEKIEKLKAKEAEYREKGNRLQEKANEAFSRADAYEKKIEEIKNSQTLEEAKKLKELGLTLEDVNKALEKGDLTILQKKIEQNNNGARQDTNSVHHEQISDQA